MISKPYIQTILTLIIAISLGISFNAYAQNPPNNDVQSLSDILNDEEDYGSNGKPLTSEIMANHYYKTCSNKKNLSFDEEETKIICACSSAKMSEILSVQEFKDLEKKTKAGKDARGKYIAYAYAPCMKHVIERKVKHDCYASKSLDDVVSGKKSLCKCVVDRFKYHIDQNATLIVRKATHYNPMTLNPLEEYFKHDNYYSQRDHTIKQCRFEFFYKIENR
ncbi:MAG: hypothetical protein ACRBB3_06325 [Alphaproteobacteria bacterium]